MFVPVVNQEVLNGPSQGPVGDYLQTLNYDVGYSRPYFGDDGRQYCLIQNSSHSNGKPKYRQELVSRLANNGLTVNGPTSLRKLEWIQLDEALLKAARERLRAWGDLSAANSFGGFNGMAKLILEHETMSDPGMARMDFDGLTESRTDSPLFQLQGLPLPLFHSDFWFSSRRLAVSRNSGTPLDMTMGEAAARRVAELIERVTIGSVVGPSYGGTPIAYGRTPSVYGYINYPDRLLKTNLNNPSSGGWTPSKTLSDVLAMIDLLTAQNFFGPFMLYTSNDWDQYMDNDYILTGGNVATSTLRNRLRQIDVIQDVRRLDFLHGTASGIDNATMYPFSLLLVQMTSDVARAVNGMDLTTLQWPSMGGMRVNYKVMAIQVPQLRSDFNHHCGILQAHV